MHSTSIYHFFLTSMNQLFVDKPKDTLYEISLVNHSLAKPSMDVVKVEENGAPGGNPSRGWDLNAGPSWWRQQC